MSRRGRSWSALAAMVTVSVAACSSSGPKSCGSLASCQAAAVKRFGHQVLTPADAIYVYGAFDRGVIGLEFRDTASAQTFSVFAGRPGSKQVSCPGQVVQVSGGRSVCAGRTTTSVRAQFVSGNLLYTVDIPTATANKTITSLSGNEQAFVTRLLAGFH